MARHAPQVFTEPGDVARIEALVTHLPNLARVRIHLADGDSLEATVVERPATQIFEDDAGRHGVNAIVRVETGRVEDRRAPPRTAYVWLGDIAGIDRLDTA